MSVISTELVKDNKEGGERKYLTLYLENRFSVEIEIKRGKC